MGIDAALSRRVTLSAHLIALLGGLACAPDVAHSQTLPKDLQAQAARHGCAEVQGFFDRPGMVLPPYVYGVFPGGADASAAFWCQRQNSARTQYLLVFVSNTDHLPVDCPDTLVWGGGLPRGLSLAASAHVPLVEFHTVSGARLSLPPNATTEYAPLRDYYDGVERLFYCYRGQWLVRVQH